MHRDLASKAWGIFFTRFMWVFTHLKHLFSLLKHFSCVPQRNLIYPIVWSQKPVSCQMRGLFFKVYTITWILTWYPETSGCPCIAHLSQRVKMNTFCFLWSCKPLPISNVIVETAQCCNSHPDALVSLLLLWMPVSLFVSHCLGCPPCAELHHRAERFKWLQTNIFCIMLDR